MEFQLIAARAGLPINSVYQSRLPTNCLVEAMQREANLRPGTLYLYLDSPEPEPEQLGGADPARVCGMVDWLRYCLIPAPTQASGAGGRSATTARP
jgi:hypothetical protein